MRVKLRMRDVEHKRREEVGSKQPCFTEPRMHVAPLCAPSSEGMLISTLIVSHMKQERTSQSSSSWTRMPYTVMLWTRCNNSKVVGVMEDFSQWKRSLPHYSNPCGLAQMSPTLPRCFCLFGDVFPSVECVCVGLLATILL